MAETHIIEILSPIEAKVDNYVAAVIKPVLSYNAVYYRQGAWKKERKEWQKPIITKGKNCHYFLLGFIRRVKNRLNELGIPYKIKGAYPILPYKEPDIPGINLREDQKEIIAEALKKQRGIIQAPTGSGKTLLGIAICSALEGNVLWLCHTIDLMNQSYQEFKKAGFKNVYKLGGGEKETSFSKTGRSVVVSTRQTFSDPDILEKLSTFFDIVIIDEVHHCGKEKSEYTKILTNLVAPVRIGLTATLPDKEESKLISEGLLGPLITKLSIQKGNELGIIAKPIIKLLRVPKNYKIAEIRKYHDVYQKAIVENLQKNQLIVSTAKKHLDKGESVLIIVNLIEHGENILSLMREQNIPSDFVQGKTEGEARLELKAALNEKRKCIICTSVWKEGLNFPELNVVINAAGGKSEIMTLQAIGRGLRVTEKKKFLIFYDIFDPSSRFTVEHFGERLCLYMDNNWI